jgi:hypothetical protein
MLPNSFCTSQNTRGASSERLSHESPRGSPGGHLVAIALYEAHVLRDYPSVQPWVVGVLVLAAMALQQGSQS